jgi:hypothetical protein
MPFGLLYGEECFILDLDHSKFASFAAIFWGSIKKKNVLKTPTTRENPNVISIVNTYMDHICSHI